jgi:hypothetical protein
MRPVAEEPVQLMHRTSGRSKNSLGDRHRLAGRVRDDVDHPGREPGLFHALRDE